MKQTNQGENFLRVIEKKRKKKQKRRKKKKKKKKERKGGEGRRRRKRKIRIRRRKEKRKNGGEKFREGVLEERVLDRGPEKYASLRAGEILKSVWLSHASSGLRLEKNTHLKG